MTNNAHEPQPEATAQTPPFDFDDWKARLATVKSASVANKRAEADLYMELIPHAKEAEEAHDIPGWLIDVASEKPFLSLSDVLPVTVTTIVRPAGLPWEKGFRKPGMHVSVRPCLFGPDEEEKSYFGILLGDLSIGPHVSYERKSGVLTLGDSHNPAIWVPELKRVVFGAESWWGPLKSAGPTEPPDLNKTCLELLEAGYSAQQIADAIIAHDAHKKSVRQITDSEISTSIEKTLDVASIIAGGLKAAADAIDDEIKRKAITDEAITDEAIAKREKKLAELHSDSSE